MTDWQQDLTAHVARNIEHYRARLGLQRVELAARCTALGLPTKRPALAALLDGRRQTVTLQELVVLAEALETSVAELVVPLHTGDATRSGPTRTEHAIDAAARLFAVDLDPLADGPYRPFLRYRRAAARFERANRRLAELSHDLASGTANTIVTDGRPHPASEILAVEGAFSRLLDAREELSRRDLEPPPLGPSWPAFGDDQPRDEFPVLGLLPDQGRPLLPMLLYRLHADQLPSARLVTEP